MESVRPIELLDHKQKNGLLLAGDVLAHILLIYWFIKLDKLEITLRRIFSTILVLMGLYLLSYSCLFFYPYIIYFVFRKRTDFFRDATAFVIHDTRGNSFFVYFLIFYYFQLRLNNKDETLKLFWSEYILYHHLSLNWFKVFTIQSAKFVYYALHFELLWVIPVVAGGFFWRKTPRPHRQVLEMFVAVYATLILASIAGKWPIGGMRVNLFIIPYGIILFTVFLQLCGGLVN